MHIQFIGAQVGAMVCSNWKCALENRIEFQAVLLLVFFFFSFLNLFCDNINCGAMYLSEVSIYYKFSRCIYLFIYLYAVLFLLNVWDRKAQ
jgi:hypothetical protein